MAAKVLCLVDSVFKIFVLSNLGAEDEVGFKIVIECTVDNIGYSKLET